MKDKLRELAERLATRIGSQPHTSISSKEVCEFLTILDAEGDGGTVAWQDKVNEIANNIGESLNAGCDQDAVNRINVYVDELFALTAHPARSGVVSDEDVEAACILSNAK